MAFIAFASITACKKGDEVQLSADADPEIEVVSNPAEQGEESLVPSAPTNLVLAPEINYVTNSIDMSWSITDAADRYEVSIGTSSGARDALDWTEVGSNESHSLDVSNLPNLTTLFVSIRAVSSMGTPGEPSESGSFFNFYCPENWIMVSGNSTPGLGGTTYTNGTMTRHDGSSRTQADFCVMKYEMKLHDGTSFVADGNFSDSLDYASPPAGIMAVSTPEHHPWVEVDRSDIVDALDAERACENITAQNLVDASVNSHFHLINNNQWMAIARDIEENGLNVSGGVINRGHADAATFDALPADSNDDNGCFGLDASNTHDGSDPEDDCGGSWFLNKRTHTLSNGVIIWDFAGNTHEWVLDDAGTASITPSPGYEAPSGFEYTASACDPTTDQPCMSATNRLLFGPLTAGWNSTNGIGRPAGGAGGGVYDGGIYRGGNSFRGNETGIYFVGLNRNPHSQISTGKAAGITSRCVWAP